MKRQSWAKKVDSNQGVIVKALERIGCQVEPLSGCAGMPDLLVSLGARLFLLEVKNKDGKNKVGKEQIEFHKRFPVAIVRTVEEALDAVTK